MFAIKQEDIQKLSSLDQQTCLCKGKFDTEYVLFTPHALPIESLLKKHSLVSPEVRNVSLRTKIISSLMSLQKSQSKRVCTEVRFQDFRTQNHASLSS